MSTSRQISIFLQNRPGELARICDILARRQVNIQAISVSDTVDFGVVRFIPDEPDEARKVLRQEGLEFMEGDVLAIEMQNKPGALGEVAHKLAKAKVNIEYAYVSLGSPQGFATVILRVSNISRAKQALNER